MITAAEAKQQVLETVLAKHKEAIGKVENAILVAVKSGETKVTFYMPSGFPEDFIKAYLKELGYFVKVSVPFDQRDRPSLLIDWE